MSLFGREDEDIYGDRPGSDGAAAPGEPIQYVPLSGPTPSAAPARRLTATLQAPPEEEETTGRKALRYGLYGAAALGLAGVAYRVWSTGDR